jgi:hypothetical protein
MQNRVRDYAKARGFHRQILERWLAWPAPAGAALCRLAAAFKIGENHLRDIMDWLEEIELRDGRAIDAILADRVIAEIETDPRLSRADKLKRIKEQLRRQRFPRLAATEDAIKKRIHELKLRPEITMAAPAGLEGGGLRIEFTASSQQELKRLAAKLGEAADHEAVREAFALLSGAAAGGKGVESP